jgi:hypothetical protein
LFAEDLRLLAPWFCQLEQARLVPPVLFQLEQRVSPAEEEVAVVWVVTVWPPEPVVVELPASVVRQLSPL